MNGKINSSTAVDIQSLWTLHPLKVHSFSFHTQTLNVLFLMWARLCCRSSVQHNLLSHSQVVVAAVVWQCEYMSVRHTAEREKVRIPSSNSSPALTSLLSRVFFLRVLWLGPSQRFSLIWEIKCVSLEKLVRGRCGQNVRHCWKKPSKFVSPFSFLNALCVSCCPEAVKYSNHLLTITWPHHLYTVMTVSLCKQPLITRSRASIWEITAC